MGLKTVSQNLFVVLANLRGDLLVYYTQHPGTFVKKPVRARVEIFIHAVPRKAWIKIRPGFDKWVRMW